MADPHWTAYLSALATPTLAIFGSLIAYRQWRTSQDKLKLDLFDRRAAIYQAARDMISSVLISGQTSLVQEREYLTGTRGAQWLYGQEIVAYLDTELWGKLVDLGLYQSQLSGPLSPADHARIIQAQADTKKWLSDQMKVIDSKFSPYLSLKH